MHDAFQEKPSSNDSYSCGKLISIHRKWPFCSRFPHFQVMPLVAPPAVWNKEAMLLFTLGSAGANSLFLFGSQCITLRSRCKIVATPAVHYLAALPLSDVSIFRAEWHLWLPVMLVSTNSRHPGAPKGVRCECGAAMVQNPALTVYATSLNTPNWSLMNLFTQPEKNTHNQ